MWMTVLAVVAGAQSVAELELPPEQRCLEGEGLAMLAGDTGLLDGLSPEQVVTSMRAQQAVFQLVCTHGRPEVRGEVELDIVVACTGRVARAEVVSTVGVPAEVAGCVGEVSRFIAFDAHDMLDGYRFGYVLRFTGPQR